MQEKVTLDRKIFEALASETRINILKSLDERPKTIAELSRELKFSKSSLHEHLSKMLDVGLVEKQEYSKWVYYRLTEKGRNILHPHERTKILVLLSLSLLSLATGIFELSKVSKLRTTKVKYLTYATPEATELGRKGAINHVNIYSYALPIVLLAICVSLLYLTYRMWRKRERYRNWRPEILSEY